MKKLIGIGAVLLIASVALVGCQQTPANGQNHPHNFGEWKTVQEPSCTENGLRERRCACGQTESEPISATEHSMVAGVCMTCGEVNQQELLEFTTMQKITLSRLPDGTYSVKANEQGRVAKQLAIPAEFNGKKITAIAEDAFRLNKNLTSITLPDSITSIGKSAFEGCTELRTVDLPEGVAEIGDRAFFDCGKITKLHVPASTVRIGKDAFGYTSLTELTVAAGNPVYHCQYNALIHTADKVLVKATEQTTQIPADGSVTVIGERAFYGVWGISKLVVPEGVTEIGREAFGGCPDLIELHLPASLTKVGEQISFGAKGGEIQHVYYGKTADDWLQLTTAVNWFSGGWDSLVFHATDRIIDY
ncbi:MAG: leucine-rich repeat domain-containing protein [Clostridia bacterium]|nr:leucine-rich repeat domain-containing protein [Clostridia bacterium]